MATCVVVTAAVLPTFLTGALAVQIRQDLDFGTAALGLATAAFFFAAAATSFGFGRSAERLGPVAVDAAVVGLLSAVVLLAVAVAGPVATPRCSPSSPSAAWPTAWPNRRRTSTSPGSCRYDRQGLAFAVKQSRHPDRDAARAGSPCPLLGLTVGWRWAFVAGAVAGCRRRRSWSAEPSPSSPAPAGRRRARRSAAPPARRSCRSASASASAPPPPVRSARSS